MAKFGIGQPVRRVEDQRFLTGQGRYVDDIVLPGMAARLQRAVAARPRQDQEGRCRQGQGRARRAAGADRRRRRCRKDRRADLASDAGGFRRAQGPPHLPAAAGQPTGSATSATASPSSSPRRWRRRATPPSWSRSTTSRCRRWSTSRTPPSPTRSRSGTTIPAGNNAFRLMFGNKEATDAAFASAKHVVKLRVENNRLSPVSMEPRVAIGDYNAATDETTLYAAYQNPHGARMEVSHIFHVPENRIRVVSPDVGGGFGLKGGFFPEDGLVVWAARKLRRPVKWVSTRSEAMLNDHHGREMVYYGELALDEHGKILGAALQVAVPDGRLFRRRGARRRRLLDPLRAGRLRHPDHAHHVAGRVHQHLAERAVSRRRPPGGRLFHGAADRARRQRHRHRPRRNPPPQSHPEKQAALHHADALGLRLGRVRPPDGPVHGEQRLEGLRRAPARIEEERQAARPRRCASTSSSAASSTTAWT